MEPQVLTSYHSPPALLCNGCCFLPRRGRLAKLLRFHTSKSPSELTSLADYVSRMKPGQKTIYWIGGFSQEEVAHSPFAEKLVAEVGTQRGLLVLSISLNRSS